jgi:hypothetical protein
MSPPPYGHSAGGAPGPRAQFTVLELSLVDDDELLEARTAQQTAAPRIRFGVPGAAPLESGLPGRGTATDRADDASIAERLRYNLRPFSPPVAPAREPDGQRAIREARERVRRAGEELGPLPPNGVTPSRGGGAGIRIPFGFGPPPPAITVPAPPPPDSIVRRDSIRTAARAAARQDSLRAARDPARLRNVAPRRPVTLPPPVPDTTIVRS